MTAPNTTTAVPPSAIPLAFTAVTAAQSTSLFRISDRLLFGLLMLWRSFDGYYSPAAVDGFAEQAAALVIAAQEVTGEVTEQSVRLQLEQLGVDLPGGAIVGLLPDLRLGALTADVYRRPIETVRYLTSVADRSSRTPTADAVKAGEERLLSLAETDLQLAHTIASQQTFYETPRSTRFRRVIHPELSKDGKGTCGLCIAASDQIYGRENLLPLHPGCHCTVAAIVGKHDPGKSVNLADLQRVYEAAGSTAAGDLRKTRVQVNEHGELGPVLTRKGQQFRDPKDVAADSRSAAEKRKASLEAQRTTLRAQLQRAGLTPGQASWLGDRIDRIERELLNGTG